MAPERPAPTGGTPGLGVGEGHADRRSITIRLHAAVGGRVTRSLEVCNAWSLLGTDVVAIITGLSGVLLAQEAVPVSTGPSAGRCGQAGRASSAPGGREGRHRPVRINGAKTLSSLPYSLNAAEGQANEPSTRIAGPDSNGRSLVQIAIQYHDVGSSIDCDVTLLADGRYRLGLTIDDSSLAEGTPPSGPDSSAGHPLLPHRDAAGPAQRRERPPSTSPPTKSAATRSARRSR